MAYIALVGPKTKAPITTIIPSITCMIRAIEMCFTYRCIRDATRSVPPVVPRPKNTRPIPVPWITPPINTASTISPSTSGITRDHGQPERQTDRTPDGFCHKAEAHNFDTKEKHGDIQQQVGHPQRNTTRKQRFRHRFYNNCDAAEPSVYDPVGIKCGFQCDRHKCRTDKNQQIISDPWFLFDHTLHFFTTPFLYLKKVS